MRFLSVLVLGAIIPLALLMEPASANDGFSGRWESQLSSMEIPKMNGNSKTVFSYQSVQGEGVIVGEFTGDEFTGEWVSLNFGSRSKCPVKRLGLETWGHVKLTLNRNKISALWRMCEGYRGPKEIPGSPVWTRDKKAGIEISHRLVAHTNLDEEISSKLAHHRKQLGLASSAGDARKYIQHFLNQRSLLSLLLALDGRRAEGEFLRTPKATSYYTDRFISKSLVEHRSSLLRTAGYFRDDVSNQAAQDLDAASLQWSLDVIQANLAAMVLSALKSARKGSVSDCKDGAVAMANAHNDIVTFSINFLPDNRDKIRTKTPSGGRTFIVGADVQMFLDQSHSLNQIVAEFVAPGRCFRSGDRDVAPMALKSRWFVHPDDLKKRLGGGSLFAEIDPGSIVYTRENATAKAPRTQIKLRMSVSKSATKSADAKGLCFRHWAVDQTGKTPKEPYKLKLSPDIWACYPLPL